MRQVKIKIDGNEYEMPRAFRAIAIIAATGRDTPGGYRIYEERGPSFYDAKQLHYTEWVTPKDGDSFCCVPYAIGPGGGDDQRVELIRTACEVENGRDDAWQLLEESERCRG